MFFTAHSLPERAVADGDPYPDQVAESAADVAGLLGLDADPTVTWSMAWQSAGRTADPWIGPDLLAEIGRVAADGATAVVVCPVGFVSDHLEILYDLDIEARDRAPRAGHGLRPDRLAQRRPRLPRPAGRCRCATQWPPTSGERRPAAGGRRWWPWSGAAWPAWPPRGSWSGRRRTGPPREVVLLEAGSRLGGKVRSAEFCGRTVDLAADAFLARRPEATDLCAELGLTGDRLVPVGQAAPRCGYAAGCGSMPDGVNLGVPTRAWPMVRSGILTPGGSLRAGARPGPPPPGRAAGPPATGRWATSSGTASGARWSSGWSTRWSAGSTPAGSTT